MALENIPPIGDDAFKNGMLNKKYAQKVVSRLNSWNKFTVTMPPGLGSGKIVNSEDGIILDLSQMKVPPAANFDVWISGTLTTWAFNAKMV